MVCKSFPLGKVLLPFSYIFVGEHLLHIPIRITVLVLLLISCAIALHLEKLWCHWPWCSLLLVWTDLFWYLVVLLLAIKLVAYVTCSRADPSLCLFNSASLLGNVALHPLTCKTANSSAQIDRPRSPMLRKFQYGPAQSWHATRRQVGKKEVLLDAYVRRKRMTNTSCSVVQLLSLLFRPT